MTWLWRICSRIVGQPILAADSLSSGSRRLKAGCGQNCPPHVWLVSALLLQLLTATLAAATVSGSVQLAESKDPNVRRKSDYSGVVVWLESSTGGARAV